MSEAAAPPVASEAAPEAAVSAPALELSGIVKSWPGLPRVLDDVTLTLEAGSAIAIFGANGIGKTTLLRIASGLILPDGGTVRLQGLDPEAQRTEFQRRLGFLSAGNSGLYARLKPEHHLDMWARLALIPKARRGEAIARVRELFDLDVLCGRRVDRLSMGQRQRLRLALAFLHDPDVVLLDEPGTSLDDAGLELVRQAVESIKSRGGAAIVCLPGHWEELGIADSAYELANGSLVRA
jgi:ABC-2 type transport system ATP-binding protein